jgi:DNA polymerase-1
MAEWDAHQRASRALSMWFIGWPSMIGPDGRLRATFRQGHVRSGRLSVERVQLHAIPNRHGHIEGVPHVRSLFKAKEGHELWNLDLSQAELRIAAKQANCVRMLEMLEGGADLHGVTTTEVFKIDPDHHEWKIRRDAGKRLTFSAIFQIGPQEYQRVLAKEGLHWSLAECDRAVYAWRDTYPEFGQSFYRWMRVAENQGWIELVGGERAWFYVPHVDKPATAWSRRVQGSLALFVKRWLIDAEKTCRRQGTPDALVGTVHDSLVLELPQERGAEIARLVADRAERSGRAMFDIDMPVEVSPWHD